MRKPLLVYLSVAGLLTLPHLGRDAAGRWEMSAPMRDADASTAVAYTLEELIDEAPSVVVAKALERESKWEKVGDSKRIVTYTTLQIDSEIIGEGEPSTLRVRTLGGIVGKIGQQVAGEARFEIGRTSVVFLARSPQGITVVAGAAQGHYPAVAEERDEADEAPVRLRVSPSLGKIIERPGPRITAIQRLVGRSVPDAVTTIREAKAELDAHRKNEE